MNAPRLSIVIPIYNEEATLEIIIDRVFAACGDFAEVIFVDDGSRDGSPGILKRKARRCDTVIAKENGGKGSAVRKGYNVAKGHYVIVQDADLEYSPEEIPALLEYAEKNNHPVVYGSRRLKKQKQFTHFLAYVGGTALTIICNILYGTRLTDQPTCYKMVRTDIIKSLPLKENDFRFDPELTAMIARRGISFAEYPITYAPRSWREGKKIVWQDWFKWVWVFVALRVASKRSLGIAHSP